MEMNINIKNIAMPEDTARSSQHNSKQNLEIFSNISPLQQFQNGKCRSTMPMDYELILNSQTEEDRVSEANPISKTNCNEKDGNEAEYGNIVCDDQFCSTGCDKDVDFDMVIKDCDNSGIDKDEDCDVEIKLQDKNEPTYTNDEISKIQKDQSDSADIEADEDCRMVTKHKEVCDKIEINKNNKSSSGDNSKMLNVDYDKMNNIRFDEDCDGSNMLQQESSHINSFDKFEDFDTDFFDIRSSDSEEEFQPGVGLSFVRGKGSNKTSKQKPSVKCSVKNTAAELKYEASILSEFDKKQVDDFNFQENELHVKNLEENDSNLSDELFCLTVPLDNSTMCSNKADQNDCDRVVNTISKQPSQGWSNGCLDNDMSAQSGIFDGNTNQTTVSFINSETDPGSYAGAHDFVQVSPEFAAKTESFNSSRHLEHGKKSSPCSDTGIAQCNSSLVNADTTNSVASSAVLRTKTRSSISGGHHFSIEEIDMSITIQVQSADQKNVLTTKALPLMESSLPDLLISRIMVDNPGEVVVNVQKPQVPSHPLEGEDKQQHILSNINICKATDKAHNIPSTSAYLPEKVGIKATGVIGPTKEHLSTTQIFPSAEFNSLQSLLQVPVSSSSTPVDVTKAVTDKRHIKSFLNNYVHHRWKGEDSSNEAINNIADEFAIVLKSSRKRPHSTNHTSQPVAKKSYTVASDLTEDAIDSSKECKMEMDVVCNSYGRPSSQSRKLMEEYVSLDSVISLCQICETSNPGSRSVKCGNSHMICQSCLEDEIRLVMASEKMCLSCPEESCKSAITLDSLSSVLPSLIVDLLSDNLRLKEQKASAKAIKKMQGLVICPRCSCPGLLEEHMLHFLCTTCNSHCCRYCKATWTHNDEHEGCLLLSFVGSECFKDISKPPQNWNISITPFNKNFVQVNVPLNSHEGSAVAAFFAKTSSGKSHVVQIFRIQNQKLWEKYVLKRKHVEHEIGAAELKEKFLFHGTKAENIVTICGEGFDMRVPTSNGALLGKGIYFSITAKYSEKFADKSGRLFLSRVICGWSQHGQRQLTRPQYHGTSRRMYDSCVDNVSSPTMYTVFDNSQCYPEYLIQFVN